MLNTSTKTKLSISAPLAFFSIVAGLVGIPGMMDDLARWQEWIATAREVIPWGWAMLATGGSLLGAVAPWVPWHRFRVTSTTTVPLQSATHVQHADSVTQFHQSTIETIKEDNAAFDVTP